MVVRLVEEKIIFDSRWRRKIALAMQLPQISHLKNSSIPQTRVRRPRQVHMVLLAVIALALSGCGDTREPAASGGGDLPTGLPQAELAAAFEASSAAIFEARTAAELAQIRAGNQVSLAPSDSGLRVVATGNDPSVALPPFAAGKKFILQITIDSPADTGIQLFYLAGGATDYSNAASHSYVSARGANVIYFGIDAPGVKDPLRLDPGYTPGEYTIRSVVAREWAR